MPTMKTIKQISEKCGMSYDSIRKLCLEGKIVFVRAGNKYLINEEKFIEYLNKGEQKNAETHND